MGTFKGHDLALNLPEADHMELADNSIVIPDTSKVSDENTSNLGQSDIILMVLDTCSHPDVYFPTVTVTDVCDALLQKTSDPHLAIKASIYDWVGTFTIESKDRSP